MSNERTPAFLLANLGSEVSRLLFAHHAGDSIEAERSHKRALRIFEALESSPISEAGRGEVRILREVVEDALRDRPVFVIKEETLKSYFVPFARRVLPIS